MTPSSAPVGIIGAGPIGLTLALRLASFGIPSILLEADPELRKMGSKACLIQGDVLEILDKFGCADQIADEGVTWTVGRTYVRGKQIRATEYPRPIGFGPFVNISQFRIEQILLEKLEKTPLCEIRWSSRVTGVEQDADGVTVRVTDPDDIQRRMSFGYVAACDGIRSTMRELVGVEWTGYSHKDKFLITDIRAELPLAKERHFHYDPPFNPGRQLVMHPQPDNIWRIDWQLPPDADIDEEVRTNQLDRRIRDVIGEVPYEIDWMSTYRFHQRVVDRLRVGRIFFAGDAAHALPPYGSRGMNSGIQDADNLAWKLALVVDGRADDALLDSYHDERYAAARENLRITEATIRFMVPPSPLRRWLRTILLTLVAPFKSLRRHVNSGNMAEPHVYTASPIIDPPAAGPLVGRFAPDGAVQVDGRATRLRQLFGDEFICLYVGDDAHTARLLSERVNALAIGVPLHCVLVVPPETPPDGLAAPTVVASRQDPALLTRYQSQPPVWHLIRPDGHIAATRPIDRIDDLAAIVRRCADVRPVTLPSTSSTGVSA